MTYFFSTLTNAYSTDNRLVQSVEIPIDLIVVTFSDQHDIHHVNRDPVNHAIFAHINTTLSKVR